MRLSPHVSYLEVVKSQTAERFGIDNVPGTAELEALKLVAAHCFEPARAHFGVPIAITSGYRSEVLNAAIGGSPTSAHCRGEALDLDADVFGGLTNRELFEWLRDHVSFDQLIWELGTDAAPAWVHVSYRGGGNRQQVLRARRVGGAIRYERYQEAA